MNGQYSLNEEGEPVNEPDLIKWARTLGKKERVVAREKVGKSDISTVFLGLDHRFGPGTPILWETMVFGGELDQEMDRCGGSREQAEAMHAAMVKRVKEGK